MGYWSGGGDRLRSANRPFLMRPLYLILTVLPVLFGILEIMIRRVKRTELFRAFCFYLGWVGYCFVQGFVRNQTDWWNGPVIIQLLGGSGANLSVGFGLCFVHATVFGSVARWAKIPDRSPATEIHVVGLLTFFELIQFVLGGTPDFIDVLASALGATIAYFVGKR